MEGKHGNMMTSLLEMGLLAAVSDPTSLLASPPTNWTDLCNHDRVNAHLLEATGVVQHVCPAQCQGEDHGSHVQFLATEVQHHRAQEEQRVNKAERQARNRRISAHPLHTLYCKSTLEIYS